MSWEMGWIATFVTGGATAIIAFATFWMALSARIVSASNRARHAEELAATATTVSATFTLKHDMLAREINDVRVRMAEKIATLEAATDNTARALQQTEQRITSSLEGLSEKVDKLSDTIIRSLTEWQRKPPPSHHA